MSRFFRWLPDVLLGYPKTVLALLFVVTASLGSLLPRITTDFTFERIFSAHDDEVAIWNRSNERFGKDDNAILILLEVRDGGGARDAFDPKVVAEVRRISEALGRLDGISRVVSLTEAVELYPNAEGFRVGKLLEEIPEDAAARAAMRERILHHRLYGGRLVTPDARLTAIVAEIDSVAYPFDPDRVPIVLDVRRILGMDEGFLARAVPAERERPAVAAQAPELDYYLSGIPALRLAYNELTRHDQATFGPIVMILMALVLAYLFRNVQGVVLPLLTVGLSLVWALSMYVVLGINLDLINTILPTLLIVIGVSDAIHIVARYFELYAETGDKVASIKRTVHDMGLACFLTSLTSAVGFGSLYTAEIFVIRDLGVLAAAGLMCAYVVTIVFLPIALYYWRAPSQSMRRRMLEGPMSRFLDGLAEFAIRRARPIFAVSMAVFALSIWGATRVEVVTRILEDIDPNHPAAQATRLADRELGGILPLEVLLEAEPGTFKQPENLERVAAIERFVREQAEPGPTTSIADMVSLMNEAVAPEGAEGFRIPVKAETVAEYLFLFSLSGDEEELWRLVSADFASARVTTTVKDIGSVRIADLRGRIEGFLAKMDLGEIRAYVNGSSVMASNSLMRLVYDMLRSFLSAFVLIFVIMSLELRSVKLGALSMIPNTVPLLFTMGALGFAHEPVRASTAIIFAISLGIAVDDT
ncbi:MAG: MMPL family transporter, partial [Myxococcales bacterium]|nr:MMPL family transporter [Myxococcales bacterium]